MTPEHLSHTFAALADPTRRAILARLSQGHCSVTELAEPFAISQPAISKHLKVLERAGLIKRSRAAQWRPRRLDPAPLNAASSWIEQYRELATDRMDRLAAEINKLQTATEGDPRNG